MKSVTMIPTGEVCLVGGKLARKWLGKSEEGVPCYVYTVALTALLRDIHHFQEAGLQRIKDEVVPIKGDFIPDFQDAQDDESGKGMGDVD